MLAEEAVKNIAFSINELSLSFQDKPVFANLNLTLQEGERVAILGASGIGKTSLLRALAGLSHPKEHLKGSITTSNHQPLTNQIAYLSQADSLIPWLTVLDNVLINTRLTTVQHEPFTHQKEIALHLLEQVGLKKEFAQYPQQLSGGMRQRVALARTLIQDKPVVLLDEPFSALDAITRYQLQTLTLQLLKNKTVLFITHDPQESLRLANTIYIMRGQPAYLELIHTPTAEYLLDALLKANGEYQ